MAFTQPGVNQASQDIIALLDAQSFRPLFAGAHPMACTVRETSKLTQFKVEDGTERADSRVFDPVTIDFPMLLTDNTRDLFEQLRAAYLSGLVLIVQTRVSSYADMMIVEMPHDENVEQGESIPIAIKLQELKTVEAEFGALPPRSVSNPAQASTVAKGSQQTTESTPPTRRRASVLYGLTN